MKYSRNDIKGLLTETLALQEKEDTLYRVGVTMDFADKFMDKTISLIDANISDDRWLSWYLWDLTPRDCLPRKVMFSDGEVIYQIDGVDSLLDMLVLEGFIID